MLCSSTCMPCMLVFLCSCLCSHVLFVFLILRFGFCGGAPTLRFMVQGLLPVSFISCVRYLQLVFEEMQTTCVSGACHCSREHVATACIYSDHGLVCKGLGTKLRVVEAGAKRVCSVSLMHYVSFSIVDQVHAQNTSVASSM